MTQEQRYIKMTETPISRLIPSLAIPTIISMLVTSIYNMADTFFVSQISTSASAAVGVSYSLMAMIQALGFTLGMGSGNYLSRVLGSRDEEKAERIASTGFYSAILIGLLFAVVCLPNLDVLVRLLGATDTIAPYAKDYAKYILIAAPVMTGSLAMNNLLRFQGLAVYAMIGITTGGILNMILDPIFIFGFGMGVKGAALATIISQAVSCGWVLAFLTGKKTFLRIKKEYLKPVPSIVFPCLALGLSTFVMQSSESVISVCFNSSLLKYGGDLAVGAMTILTSTMQFAMLPLQGIGQGAQPIMSYNYGARNIDRMKKTFKLHLVISLIYSTLFWLFVQLFPATFAGIFSSDPELVSFTAGALRIYCGAMFLFGIQLACQMTFVAIGYAVCSIIVAVVRKFVLLLPLIFIVPMFVSNKTLGVYMAEPIADAIAVTFTAILFSIQFKKALKKLDKA